MRATVQREYPDSLFFLSPELADIAIAENERTRSLETFLTDPSADEIDIVVQNVSLSEISKPPFRATVTFQKVYYTPGTRSERERQTFVAQVERPSTSRAQRIRPGESPRPAGQLLPRRPGIRGAAIVIQNVAFLAALTLFLLAAWLAGELSFLAPHKALLFRAHGTVIGVGALLVFLNRSPGSVDAFRSPSGERP